MILRCRIVPILDGLNLSYSVTVATVCLCGRTNILPVAIGIRGGGGGCIPQDVVLEHIIECGGTLHTIDLELTVEHLGYSSRVACGTGHLVRTTGKVNGHFVLRQLRIGGVAY